MVARAGDATPVLPAAVVGAAPALAPALPERGAPEAWATPMPSPSRMEGLLDPVAALSVSVDSPAPLPPADRASPLADSAPLPAPAAPRQAEASPELPDAGARSPPPPSPGSSTAAGGKEGSRFRILRRGRASRTPEPPNCRYRLGPVTGTAPSQSWQCNRARGGIPASWH